MNYDLHEIVIDQLPFPQEIKYMILQLCIGPLPGWMECDEELEDWIEYHQFILERIDLLRFNPDFVLDKKDLVFAMYGGIEEEGEYRSWTVTLRKDHTKPVGLIELYLE